MAPRNQTTSSRGLYTATIRLTGTCNGPRRHKVHHDHTVTRPLGSLNDFTAETACPTCGWLTPLKGTG